MASAMRTVGKAMRRPWLMRVSEKTLLAAGIGAVGVYAVGDLLSGLVYDGYSFRAQAISELSAYGSPVRPLMVACITVHGLLLGAFGLGILRVADESRALRWTGTLLLASVVATLPLHPFFPMSSRGMDSGFNDTMHLILTMVFGLLVLGAVACSAVAFHGWFRIYALASLTVIMVFGFLAGQDIPDIGSGLPTPWVGTFERINAYAYFAWIVVLALVLMRRTRSTSTPERRRVAAPLQQRPNDGHHPSPLVGADRSFVGRGR
jgi:hypothetical protein